MNVDYEYESTALDLGRRGERRMADIAEARVRTCDRIVDAIRSKFGVELK